MSQYDDAPEETEDRFYAQFDSRDVKLMTLDELVAAFEAGEIHENTFVCREGESEWLTLAIVAGLGEEEEQAAPEPVAERRPPMPNRAPAVAAETRPPMPNRSPDLGSSRPPMPNRAPDIGSGRPPMPNRAPDMGESRPPMPNRRPEMNTMPASRQVSAYPPVAVAPSPPLSFAPVTSNINYADSDLDDLSMRPKRRVGRIVGGIAAIALLGGGAAFAANGGLRSFAMPSMSAFEHAGSKSQASLSLSNIEAKPSTPAPVAAPVAPTPDPAPAPAAAPTPASDSTSTPSAKAGGFSDDMKQALLAADNDRKVKHAVKTQGRASVAVAHHGRAAGSSTGFKTGGSAYDPLNGKL
jgi:hypothetical protein